MAALLVIGAVIVALAFAATAIAWAAVMLALIRRIPEANADRQIAGRRAPTSQGR